MTKLVALHPQQGEVNTYFQAESRYWNDVYTIPGVQAEIIRDRHAAVLDWIDGLALAPGSRVLEIGCGAGFMAVSLAHRGFRVHAIDSVESMIDMARTNAAKAGIADMVSFSVGDVYSLLFNDSFFDLVLAIGVIPWLDQSELAMQEMARVAKPKGYVIVSTANRSGLASLLDPLISPLFQLFKLSVKSILVKLGLRRRTPHMVFHSNRHIEKTLEGIALVKVKAMTRGFGFSFFRGSVLPEPLGTKVNRRLQQLADRNIPVLRSTGMAYFILTKKLDPGRKY